MTDFVYQKHISTRADEAIDSAKLKYKQRWYYDAVLKILEHPEDWSEDVIEFIRESFNQRLKLKNNATNATCKQH